MKTDFFKIYDALISGVDNSMNISSVAMGDYWTLCTAGNSCGIAMSTSEKSIAPIFPDGINGLVVSKAATAIKSWNLTEASMGHAAINAFYNTTENMSRLNSFESYDNYCTEGLDYTGAVVGMIGHMSGPDDLIEKAKEVFIIEREPKTGDYPDSACDYILPRCDIVLITGSSLINKTLPHLLELCENAYTILTGPTVPMCPELLEFGLDRLAGLVVSDVDGMITHTKRNIPGSPYRFGSPFLLKR